MEDVLLGVLAIAIGALFCFRGYLTMRVIIPLWGAFAGFVLGAGLVANAGDEGFLRSLLGWVVGLSFALVLGLIAYMYFEVSVILAMSAIGFALGTSVMVALGVTWSWVIILVGIVAGTLLAIVALVGELPMMLLTVLTALAGASTMVAGVMLLFGAVDTTEFTSPSATERLQDDWWWFVMYAVLALAGIVVQLRETERMRGTMREAWAASGRQSAPV
jgi:Domain of unknown function (DUF4203)